MEITIENLSSRQMVFADIFWAYQDQKNIFKFIDMLPSQELKLDALSVYHMMLAAVIDNHNDDLSSTKNLLMKIAK